MNRLFSGRSDMPFALLLLAPSLLLLGGLVAWPMVSNIEISFLRLPLNPNIESTFVGVSNYVRILSDPGFWHSLWMTVWYTALVVAGSTVLGLAVAMFFNREFRLRKTARSLVILSYVTPSISLVFAWKYMFNNGYPGLMLDRTGRHSSICSLPGCPPQSASAESGTLPPYGKHHR